MYEDKKYTKYSPQALKGAQKILNLFIEEDGGDITHWYLMQSTVINGATGETTHYRNNIFETEDQRSGLTYFAILGHTAMAIRDSQSWAAWLGRHGSGHMQQHVTTLYIDDLSPDFKPENFFKNLDEALDFLIETEGHTKSLHLSNKIHKFSQNDPQTIADIQTFAREALREVTKRRTEVANPPPAETSPAKTGFSRG